MFARRCQGQKPTAPRDRPWVADGQVWRIPEPKKLKAAPKKLKGPKLGPFAFFYLPAGLADVLTGRYDTRSQSSTGQLISCENFETAPKKTASGQGCGQLTGRKSAPAKGMNQRGSHWRKEVNNVF